MTITNVSVKLIGEDGNAFAILGKVIRKLREAGYNQEFIDGFREEATSGDYDTLLQTIMTYVNVE